jgi:para-nitrobenzyl esterase
LRWRAPRPAVGWNGIRDGGLFGPTCPQIGIPIIGSRQQFIMHEDCLYINVFTPNESNPRNLPVFFHIHMGGMMKDCQKLREIFLSASNFILIRLPRRIW